MAQGTARAVWPLIKMTIREPGSAAQVIRGLPLKREVSWMAILLAASVLALLMGGLTLMVEPEPIVTETGEEILLTPPPPLALVLQSVIGTALFTYTLHRVGARLGGQGSFDVCLRLIAWLQVVMAILVLVLLVAVFALPLMLFAMLGAVALIVVYFRTLGHFVKEMHGFDTMGAAVRTIVFSVVALYAAMILIGLVLGPIFGGGTQ